jgi:hypothetical protein
MKKLPFYLVVKSSLHFLFFVALLRWRLLLSHHQQQRALAAAAIRLLLRRIRGEKRHSSTTSTTEESRKVLPQHARAAAAHLQKTSSPTLMNCRHLRAAPLIKPITHAAAPLSLAALPPPP